MDPNRNRMVMAASSKEMVPVMCHLYLIVWLHPPPVPGHVAPLVVVVLVQGGAVLHAEPQAQLHLAPVAGLVLARLAGQRLPAASV